MPARSNLEPSERPRRRWPGLVDALDDGAGRPDPKGLEKGSKVLERPLGDASKAARRLV
jgi:hypothetical protein